MRLQQLCVDHLLQHNETLLQQANAYAVEFDELSDQIEHLSFDEQFTTAEGLHNAARSARRQVVACAFRRSTRLDQRADEAAGRGLRRETLGIATGANAG